METWKDKYKMCRQRMSIFFNQIYMCENAHICNYPTSVNYLLETVSKKTCIYLPTPPHRQDVIQGQFLSGVQQVWIQNFPFPRLVA